MHHSHLALAQPGRAGGPACALPAEVARFLRCRPAPLPPSRPPRARNTALRVLPQPPHNASPKYLAEVLKIFHNEWKGGKSFPAVRRAARPPPSSSACLQPRGEDGRGWQHPWASLLPSQVAPVRISARISPPSPRASLPRNPRTPRSDPTASSSPAGNGSLRAAGVALGTASRDLCLIRFYPFLTLLFFLAEGQRRCSGGRGEGMRGDLGCALPEEGTFSPLYFLGSL